MIEALKPLSNLGVYRITSCFSIEKKEIDLCKLHKESANFHIGFGGRHGK